MKEAIFWPMIAQVGLTAFVWFIMYTCRLSEIRSRRINPQSLSTRQLSSDVLENVTAADNLHNLFETPVLFFAVCISLAITGEVTPLQLTLAWTYVGLRAAHSIIHITYNRVVHRFIVYTISTLCLFAMWIIFAASLVLGNTA
jgi:hypothetical protein